MTKMTLTAFIFGSTALATSMSFLPLADAKANPLADSAIYEQDTAKISNYSHVGNDLEAIAVSMIGHGYDSLFQDVSDESSDSSNYILKSDQSSRSNPDEKVGNFTTSDATEIARYAQAAYAFANPEADKDIQRFINEGSKVYTLKPLKNEVTWVETTFQNQDTGIFVERADGTAVLSFKGSDRLNTWLSDFNPVMINHEDGGRYHSGFLTMYKELEASAWNHIMNFAEKNEYSIKDAMEKITITGHSRGAGCAQVFADIAQRKTGAVSPMITFAAPRALHKKTAGAFNKLAKDNHLNILQAKDIVGYAALSSLNGGAHIGHKVYLPVDGASFMHMMGGYRKMLNTMHVLGEVKRNKDSQIGNTYKFVSANADEKRDLSSESDNSAQAWIETGIEAVKNPKEAANSLSDRANWVANNPVEALDSGTKTMIQIGKNIGEVALNTANIAKLALIGTAKQIEKISKSSAAKSAMNSIKKVANQAYSAVKFW